MSQYLKSIGGMVHMDPIKGKDRLIEVDDDDEGSNGIRYHLSSCSSI